MGWLVVAVGLEYGIALVAPVVRGRLGVRTGWAMMAVVLVCPVIIPAANSGLRALAMFVAGDLGFKMVDCFRHWDRVERSGGLRAYYRFLVPLPVLSVVFPDHKRRLAGPVRPGPEVARLLAGVVGALVAVGALQGLGRVALVRSSFALNHAVVLVTFVLAIESISRALWGLDRLAGFDTAPLVRCAFVSRTVSEFWRRYNYRMHDWFYRNVFRPSGGRRAPARGVLLVFLASGVIHEAAFALAISRLNGYQLAFFTIQGPAALASGHLERLARRGGLAGKVVAHGASILFMGVTSVLFFDGVSKVFPFIYASKSPLP